MSPRNTEGPWVRRALVVLARAVSALAPLAADVVVTDGFTGNVMLKTAEAVAKLLMDKIKEAILAKRMEERLSKDEILYLYLNQIYFGNGAYGLDLTDDERALQPPVVRRHARGTGVLVAAQRLDAAEREHEAAGGVDEEMIVVEIMRFKLRGGLHCPTFESFAADARIISPA